jgi:hypothetical protein
MTGLTGDALYMNCPHCRLSIERNPHWLTIKHCPRCLGQNRTLVELFKSPLPAQVLYADNSLLSRGTSPVATGVADGAAPPVVMSAARPVVASGSVGRQSFAKFGRDRHV